MVILDDSKGKHVAVGICESSVWLFLVIKTPARASPSSWVSNKNARVSTPTSSSLSSSQNQNSSEMVLASFFVKANGDIQRRHEHSWYDGDEEEEDVIGRNDNDNNGESDGGKQLLPLPFYTFAEAKASQPFTYFERFDAFFGSLMLDRLYLLVADEVTTAVTFPFSPLMAPLQHRLSIPLATTHPTSTHPTSSSSPQPLNIEPFVGGRNTQESTVKRAKSTLWIGVPIRGGIPIPAAPKNELGRLEAFFPGPKGTLSATSMLSQYYTDWFTVDDGTGGGDPFSNNNGSVIGGDDCEDAGVLPTGSQRSPFVPMLNAAKQGSMSRRSTSNVSVRTPEKVPTTSNSSSSKNKGDGIVHFVSFLRSDHLSDGTCYYSNDVDLTVAFPFTTPSDSHHSLSSAARKGVPAPLLDCDWNAHLRRPFSKHMAITNPLHKNKEQHNNDQKKKAATPPPTPPVQQPTSGDDDEWGDFCGAVPTPSPPPPPLLEATTTTNTLPTEHQRVNSFDCENACETVLPRHLFEGEVCAKLIRGFCGSEVLPLDFEKVKQSSTKKRRALCNVELELQNADGSPLRSERRGKSEASSTFAKNKKEEQTITTTPSTLDTWIGGNSSITSTQEGGVVVEAASKPAKVNPIEAAAQAIQQSMAASGGGVRRSDEEKNDEMDEFGDFQEAPPTVSITTKRGSNIEDDIMCEASTSMMTGGTSTSQQQQQPLHLSSSTTSRMQSEACLHIALIGRQSITNPGPRYMSRGLNHQYGVGNDHVYELAMWRRVAPDNAPTFVSPSPSKIVSNKEESTTTTATPRCYRFARHTFLRGTIPVNWSTNITKYSLEAKMIFPTNPEDVKRGSLEYLTEVLRKMDGIMHNDIAAAYASLSTSLACPPEWVSATSNNNNSAGAAAAVVVEEWARLLSQYETLRNSARIRCVNLLRLDGTADEDILSFHFRRAVEEGNAELVSRQNIARKQAIAHFVERLTQSAQHTATTSSSSSSHSQSGFAAKRIESFMKEILIVDEKDAAAVTATAPPNHVAHHSPSSSTQQPPRVDFQNVDWLSTVKVFGLEYALDILWGVTVPFMLESDRQYRLPFQLPTSTTTTTTTKGENGSGGVSSAVVINAVASARILAHLPYSNRCASAVVYGSSSLPEKQISPPSSHGLKLTTVARSEELNYVRQRLRELKEEPLIFSEMGQEKVFSSPTNSFEKVDGTKCTLWDAYTMYRNAPKSGVATTGFLCEGNSSSSSALPFATSSSSSSHLQYFVDSFQTNFVRVNCADSLDRTNLTCFFMNQQASLEMMRLVGVTAEDIVPQEPPREAQFDSGDSTSQKENASRAVSDHQLRAKRGGSVATGALLPGSSSSSAAIQTGSVVHGGGGNSGGQPVVSGTIVSASSETTPSTLQQPPHVLVKFIEGMTWDTLGSQLHGGRVPPSGRFRFPLMSNFKDFSRNCPPPSQITIGGGGIAAYSINHNNAGVDPFFNNGGGAGGTVAASQQRRGSSTAARQHHLNNNNSPRDRNSFVICPYALLRSLSDLFLLNGDTIATSYTNTGAMHTNMIRGFLGRGGSSQSGVLISAQRRVENLFIDKRKFRLIEAVLGRNHSDHFPSFCSGPYSVLRTPCDMWAFSFVVGGLPVNCMEGQIEAALRHAWKSRSHNYPTLADTFNGLTVTISPSARAAIDCETQRGLYRLRLKILAKLNTLRRRSVQALQQAIKCAATSSTSRTESKKILERTRTLTYRRYDVLIDLLRRLFAKFKLPLPLETPETGAFGTSYVYHLPPTLLTSLSVQGNPHSEHLAAAEKALFERLNTMVANGGKLPSSSSPTKNNPNHHQNNTPLLLSDASSSFSATTTPTAPNAPPAAAVAAAAAYFDPFEDLPSDSMPRLNVGGVDASGYGGGTGGNIDGVGAASIGDANNNNVNNNNTHRRTLLPSGPSVRDLPQLPCLPQSPRGATTASLSTQQQINIPSSKKTPITMKMLPSSTPSCSSSHDDGGDDCDFSIVGGDDEITASGESDEENFDKCRGDDEEGGEYLGGGGGGGVGGEEEGSSTSARRLPFDCMRRVGGGGTTDVSSGTTPTGRCISASPASDANFLSSERFKNQEDPLSGGMIENGDYNQEHTTITAAGSSSSTPPHPPPSSSDSSHPPPSQLLESFDFVGNDSFLPAAAAAALAATSSSTKDGSKSNAAAVFSPLKAKSMVGDDGNQVAVYDASYTSFRTDEEECCGDEEDEASIIGQLSNQRRNSTNAAAAAAAADGSDGEFQDASVDHCAVVTVRHRETHNSRSVVVSQFLQLRYIDLFTYVDGSPFNWNKVASGVDSIFTAVLETTSTSASSSSNPPPSSANSKPSFTQQQTSTSSSFLGLPTLKGQELLLDTVAKTEVEKIDRYLLLESAYASVNNSKPTQQQGKATTTTTSSAALTLAAQEGTMQHRCTVTEYRYDADPRSTHRGAKRLQESSGSSGTYTHGMVLEEYLDELARKSNAAGNNSSNAGRGGTGDSGGNRGGGGARSSGGSMSGGQSIIAGTASKLFGFVRKAM